MIAALWLATASIAATLPASLSDAQRVVDSAGPGDTVLLGDGEYPRLVLGGAATLAAEEGKKPVVRGGIEIRSKDGETKPVGPIAIRGLEITGGVDGIKYYNAHDVLVSSCDIHDNLHQGILGVSGTRVRIVGNLIRRNGDFEGCAKDRRLCNQYHGVYATGASYSITDNIIEGNLAWGIQAAGYPYDPKTFAGPEYAGVSSWTIARNTIRAQARRGGIVVWQPDAGGVAIEGNTFSRNALLEPAEPQGIEFSHCGGGNVVRGNVFEPAPAGGQARISDTARGASYTEQRAR